MSEVRDRPVRDRQVVLITGATGPTGRAAARRFAADGASLALNGSDAGRLAALVGELGLDPASVVAVPGDLTDPAVARTVVAGVEARFGRVDVLLHLVGGWTGGTGVADLDPGEVRRMLDQHLWTTLNMLQAVLPGMVARGFGRVVAVSSPFASTPGPRGASYAMAKAAEEVLLRSVAREHAADGITANLLVVKAVDAAHERESAPSRTNASWVTPEEVAEALAWLASPEAAAVNGARIPLDGR
jgi:NAD(P)-dependent dehydrogenase (short-subunit alcohol dehydrogenase family)